MSPPITITLDPDGDLVLMLDPVEEDPVEEEAPKSEQESELMTSGEQSETRTSDVAQPICETVYKTHLVVSSKHMCFVSPVFKAMLQGGFREGEELKSMKKINLPLPDDDTEAMKILVYIIHCKHKRVPLDVDLNLFTNIAILVDKYRMHEVLSVMAPIWKKHLEADMTKTWNSVIRWICIAWVFDMHEEFRSVTQLIQKQARWSVSEQMREENLLLLPIPDHVLDKLDEARQKAAKEGIQLFRGLLDRYQGSGIICTARENISPYLGSLEIHRGLCDSMVLGCLMKSYLSLGIFPFPEEPYAKWSIHKCSVRAKKLEVTTACFTTTKNSEDNHGILKEVVKNITKLDDAAKGLNLEDLKPNYKEQV